MIKSLYKPFQHWGEDSNGIWIIGDTHFGEDDLKKGFPNRPDDDTLVKNINQKVGKNGTLVLLGDVGDIEYVRKLKGYKILIQGNHDKGRTNYERKSTNLIFGSEEEAIHAIHSLYPGQKYFMRKQYSPLTYWDVVVDIDNGLFDEVYDGPLTIGKRIILSHEPVHMNWGINIHAHNHYPNSEFDKYHKNTCADVINYSPLNLNQFIKNGGLKQ